MPGDPETRGQEGRTRQGSKKLCHGCPPCGAALPGAEWLRPFVIRDTARGVKQIGALEDLHPRDARHGHPRYRLLEILNQWIPFTTFPPRGPPDKNCDRPARKLRTYLAKGVRYLFPLQARGMGAKHSSIPGGTLTGSSEIQTYSLCVLGAPTARPLVPAVQRQYSGST